MSQHENFPQRPTLGEELFAEVVTHRSITSGPGPKRTYDNVSLSAIGEAAVEVAVTSYRYKIEGSGLFANTGNLLSDENYRKWVNHYDMLEKLRYIYSENLDINSIKEIKDLFHAFVGATYVKGRGGPENTFKWITGILEEAAKAPVSPVTNLTASPINVNETEGGSSSFGTELHASIEDTDKSKVTELQEYCKTSGLKCNYIDEQRGQTWIITYLIEGEEMESGSGPTKEMAQAKAANRALKQLQSRQVVTITCYYPPTKCRS